MTETDNAQAVEQATAAAATGTKAESKHDKKTLTFKDLRENLFSEKDYEKESETEKPNETKDEGAGESEGESEDEKIQFPKKAINAINRRDRKLAKQLAIIRSLEERIRQLESDRQQRLPEDQNEPKMENFDSYGDYLEAKIIHKIKQLQNAEAQNQQSLAQRQALHENLTRFVIQKKQEIEAKGAEYLKSIPDFAEVVQNNIEILQSLPLNIRLALLKAKDPAMAFYNISKTGRWDELIDASPYDAAFIIAEAQSMRPAFSMKSKAPSPPKTTVSGTGGSPQRLDSYKEIKKWLNS